MDSVSIRVVASRLGCSARTIHRYMEKGMPYLQARKGCQVRFSLADVVAWLLKQGEKKKSTALYHRRIR